ncbi:AAA family ATPase [Desulfobacterales bacterium HSG2]|nr:AAA family ATPase [Desulfobacterales bacterium HSG2]
MNTLSLTSLSTKNYKNLSIENGISLNNLNIFIGPNGSGKSNFIAILEFLKNCIIPNSDESQSASQFESAVAILGGSKILDKSLNFPARINFSYHFEEGLNFNLNLFAGAKNAKVSIAEESLSTSIFKRPQPFHYYMYHDKKIGEGVVSVWNDSSEQSSHFENVENVPTNSLGIVVLHNLLEKSENPPQRTPIYKIRRQITDYIKGWHFYNANNMNLEMIRSSEPKIGLSDVFLSPSGHNLALVIENLIQQDMDFDDGFNYAMKSVLPLTRRIRPVRTGLMTVNLEWHFDGLSDHFFLNEMSDGTVRMLCWATILLSPNLPSLLIIDEPELGIHAAWMPVLAEWIKRASERTQVIICTHSPDLLDKFTDFSQNVLCFSEKDQNHFSAEPLSVEMLQERLDEGWKLGDLYRVGDPSIGGWPW